jgi:TM2 domain-containing membrane protein YozV
MAIYTATTSDKKRKVALLLCIFGGMFGFHLFYVGRIGKGVLYMFTMGLFFLGVILDFLSILFGSFRDNVNAPLREW